MTAAGPTFTSSTRAACDLSPQHHLLRQGRHPHRVRPAGSVVSMEDIASHSFRDFCVQLRVVGGSGRYAHARGRLSLTYGRCGRTSG